MVVILQLQSLEEGARLYRWESGDGVLLGGQVVLGQGERASSLSVELADPALELANTLPLPIRNARVQVECWMGAGAAPPKVFAGYLANLTATMGPGRIELLATDKAKGARRVTRARNLTASNGAALVRQIARENELDVDLSEAQLDQVTFTSVLQHGESDVELLTRVLSATGHQVFVRGGTLYVRRNDATRSGANVLRLQYGENIAGVSVEVDEFTPRTTPNLFDRDGSRAGEAGDVEAQERPVQLKRTGLAIQAGDEPSYTSQQLTRALEAQARAREAFRAQVQATEAFPLVDVDDQVVLEGVGARFSGVWNIRTITHSFAPERTQLELYNGGAP